MIEGNYPVRLSLIKRSSRKIITTPITIRIIPSLISVRPPRGLRTPKGLAGLFTNGSLLVEIWSEGLDLGDLGLSGT